MTKSEFCKDILQLVDNCRSIDGMSDDQIGRAIESFIAPLAPKDIKGFAKWGHKKQQSTVNDCWDTDFSTYNRS